MEETQNTMHLNTLSPAEGSKKNRRRVGRGVGSGLGKTAGRGHNGQKSRSGGFHKVGFEGGQMPLYRRLPKRGFTAPNRANIATLHVIDLIKVDGDITIEALRAARIVPKNIDGVKIVAGGGDVTKALKLINIQVSQSVKASIEAAGGSVEFN